MPNTSDIFRARTVDGLNFPNSIALIVCRLTPVFSASSCCDIRCRARSTRMLFFIAISFVLHPVGNLENQQVDEKHPHATSSVLIKNALRNNPDWLILAEARDKEMVDVLNSAMTGIPLITTVHAFDVKSLPFRMGRMVLKTSEKLDYQETLMDIYYHFHFYFYLTKDTSSGNVKRYISEIGYIDNDGKFYYLYKKVDKNHQYYKMPKSCIDLLKIKETSESFRSLFMKEGSHE